MSKVAHGTRTGYVHGKCRCDECRAANREYQKRYMRPRYVSGERGEHGYKRNDGVVRLSHGEGERLF